MRWNDWLWWTFFLQCGDHSQTGFWDNKQYLLDPVCIFIVFVNSVLRPFLKCFRYFCPGQWENCRDCLVWVFFFVVYFFVFLFHTFQIMALWTTGTFQNDLTCVWSPTSSDMNLSAHLCTDRMERLLLCFSSFGFLFYLHYQYAKNEKKNRAKKKKSLENALQIRVRVRQVMHYSLHL